MREVARRAGWGWPSMVLMAVGGAFAMAPPSRSASCPGGGLLAFTYFPLVGDVSPARKYSHNIGMLALVCLAGWLALRRIPATRSGS